MIPFQADPAAGTIRCGLCGKTSHNPNDAAERYCGHCHVFLGDLDLVMFTVYSSPSDFPGEFVVRASAVGPRGEQRTAPGLFARGPTLASVRTGLPPGLVRFDRHPTDDPVIVEVWL